jgi:hypothetical protein
MSDGKKRTSSLPQHCQDADVRKVNICIQLKKKRIVNKDDQKEKSKLVHKTSYSRRKVFR